MNLTFTQDLELLAARDVVAGGLAGAKLSLYQTPIAYDGDQTLADYEAAKATYTGYADGSITWGVPSVSTDGVVEIVGTVPAFRPTDGATPNAIHGVYVHVLHVAGPPEILAALLFVGAVGETPIPMDSALNEIIVQVRYRPGSQSLAVILS